MRINRPSDKRLKKQLDKWKSSSSSESESETDEVSFENSVREQQIELLDMEVQDLVDELDKRGQALVNHPSMNHIKNYQQALASFLEKSLTLSKELSRQKEHKGIDDMMQGEEAKEHVIVKTIDKKMDDLTHQILESDNKSLNLAEQVGELQGLVIDLVSSIKSDSENKP